MKKIQIPTTNLNVEKTTYLFSIKKKGKHVFIPCNVSVFHFTHCKKNKLECLLIMLTIFFCSLFYHPAM
jgi:hypothetical protein